MFAWLSTLSASAWFPAALGLAGVAFGSLVGALAGAARSRSDLRREASLRREVAVREAVVAFLEATENMEGAAIMRYEQHRLPDPSLERHMWHRQKVVELTCTAPTGAAAVAYCNVLHSTVYDEDEPVLVAPWEQTRATREAFIAAARDEVQSNLRPR